MNRHCVALNDRPPGCIDLQTPICYYIAVGSADRMLLFSFLFSRRLPLTALESV